MLSVLFNLTDLLVQVALD